MLKKSYFELTCDPDLVTYDGQIKRTFDVTFRNFSFLHLVQRKAVPCRLYRPRSLFKGSWARSGGNCKMCLKNWKIN